MSKGEAGKVYFVLYLAVILELLIIIVERDEAEEHLMQKQKESMKIVQSILAQLQSGSGATGVNTRRSDEITLKGGQSGEGYDLIKEERRYFVDVGVTDVSAEISKVQNDTKLNEAEKARRFAELVDLSNARELEYQIFYSNAKSDVIPDFPTENQIKEAERARPFTSVGMAPTPAPEFSGWQLVALRKLKLNAEATKSQEPKATAYMTPVYGGYAPTSIVGSIREYAPTVYEKNPITEDQIFSYSKEQTDIAAQAVNGQYKKRTFLAYFKPKQDGWYKVRFASKTNNILGVRGTTEGGSTVSDDEEVNVGTVKLKVKELRAVRKEIARDLDGPIVTAADKLEREPSPENLAEFKKLVENEAAVAAVSTSDVEREKVGKMRVFSYIVQLLTPQASEQFAQNLGATEFDVRVVSAPKRQTGDPFVALEVEQLAVFDKAGEVRVPFTAGPLIGGSLPSVRVTSGSISATRGTATMSIASNQAQPAGASGGNNGTYDLVMSNLSPGQHTVELLHTFPGAKTQATQTFNLTVFETGMKSPPVISNYLGLPVNFRFTPNSENVIAPSQFTTTVAVDGQQGEAFSGFSKAPAVSKLPFTAKSVSYTVEWSNPRYVKERVILAQDTKQAALDAPGFTTPTQFNKSQYERNGTITFDVTIPAQEGINVNVSATEVPGKIKLIGSPSVVSQPGTNRHTVSFRVNARTVPPKGDLVVIRVSATASASSGVASEPASRQISIPVAPLRK